MKNRYTAIELDWVDERGDLARSVSDVLDAGEFGAAYWRVVSESGPSGHAVIEVLIERDQLPRFMLAYCDGDAEQALELAMTAQGFWA